MLGRSVAFPNHENISSATDSCEACLLVHGAAMRGKAAVEHHAMARLSTVVWPKQPHKSCPRAYGALA